MVNRSNFGDVQGFICKIAQHPTFLCNCNSRFIHLKKTGRSLRWLNRVLRAVSGNSRDGECFNLDKQT